MGEGQVYDFDKFRQQRDATRQEQAQQELKDWRRLAWAFLALRLQGPPKGTGDALQLYNAARTEGRSIINELQDQFGLEWVRAQWDEINNLHQELCHYRGRVTVRALEIARLAKAQQNLLPSD